MPLVSPKSRAPAPTDPAALGAWYRDCLGLDADENGLWRQVPAIWP